MSHTSVSASAIEQPYWYQFNTSLVQKLQESPLSQLWSITLPFVSTSESMLLIEDEAQRLSIAFFITQTSGPPPRVSVKVTPVNTKQYVSGYLGSDGRVAELVTTHGQPTFVSANTVDHAVKMITNSMYACAVPMAEESIGSHQNCNSCGHQLYCLARKED